jgi:hypothetical protein
MNHYHVVRSYLDVATAGYMDVNGQRLQTLERPWLNNKASKSCIPEGTYLVNRDHSGRWQYYSVSNVPNRTFIEIHPANKVSQLEGCLALGLQRAADNVSIINSESAVNIFTGAQGEDSCLITFRQYNPNTDGEI